MKTVFWVKKVLVKKGFLVTKGFLVNKFLGEFLLLNMRHIVGGEHSLIISAPLL